MADVRDLYRIDDLAKSMNLLNELSTIVKNEESTLSGGKKLGVGTHALQKLLETKAYLQTSIEVKSRPFCLHFK